MADVDDSSLSHGSSFLWWGPAHPHNRTTARPAALYSCLEINPQYQKDLLISAPVSVAYFNLIICQIMWRLTLRARSQNQNRHQCSLIVLGGCPKWKMEDGAATEGGQHDRI